MKALQPILWGKSFFGRFETDKLQRFSFFTNRLVRCQSSRVVRTIIQIGTLDGSSSQVERWFSSRLATNFLISLLIFPVNIFCSLFTPNCDPVFIFLETHLWTNCCEREKTLLLCRFCCVCFELDSEFTNLSARWRRKLGMGRLGRRALGKSNRPWVL